MIAIETLRSTQERIAVVGYVVGFTAPATEPQHGLRWFWERRVGGLACSLRMAEIMLQHESIRSATALRAIERATEEAEEIIASIVSSVRSGRMPINPADADAVAEDLKKLDATA